MITLAVTDSSKNSLEKQRQRLVLELQHLEQTYKSGLLLPQEYALAKKAMDKKISLHDQKQKQTEAKEKAVEEILGKSSMLTSSRKQTSDLFSSPLHTPSSLPSSALKKDSKQHDSKQHQKYFIKLEKPKAVAPIADAKNAVPVSKKEASEKVSLSPQKISKEKPADKKLNNKKEKMHHDSLPAQHFQDHLQIPHQMPAPSLSSSSSSYKDIDELVEQEDSNWRFALAILTLFLLLLLYVKFTSFGGSSDVITLDAYLDISSLYSKDMHGILTELTSDYGQSLWVSYHIVGSTSESILAGTGVACAARQGHGSEYLDYLFSQPVSFATNADAIAVATSLGLDAAMFSTCLSDPSIKEQYLSSQEDFAALDISYTPTLVINNKKIVGAVGYEIGRAHV